MTTTAPQPGERTAKFVHAGTRLYYGNVESWDVVRVVGDPYEENGEWWVEATTLDNHEESFPVSLYDAQLGV